MITIINNTLYIDSHIIDIDLCMQLKSMNPVMKFSQILTAFSEGNPISKADFDESCELLENKWSILKPDDIIEEDLNLDMDSIDIL